MTSSENAILVDTSVLNDLLQGARTTEAMFLEWLIRENRNLIRIADISYLVLIPLAGNFWHLLGLCRPCGSDTALFRKPPEEQR